MLAASATSQHRQPCRRSLPKPSWACVLGLFVTTGRESPLQIVPIGAQEAGRIFAVAGISGPLAAPLDAELLDQPLDALRPVPAGELYDQRLKVLFGQGLADGRPATDEVA